MKTSTEIGSVKKHVGYERAVEYVAKAGFDAFDMSMFDMVKGGWGGNSPEDGEECWSAANCLKTARRLRQIGEDNGIVCNQSHAPFPSGEKAVPYLKRAIECSAEAGVEVCVVHPVNAYTPQQNAEFYAELLDFAKECGVKIGTENMWFWNDELGHATSAACSSHQNFLEHLELIGDPSFVACLDLGHAEMKGLETTAVDMIETLGPHLQALHLHDNDKLHDSHQIPFSMDIVWEPIADALKRVGYSGWYTLEADAYLRDFSDEDTFEGVKKLHAAAEKFEKMCEIL